MACDGSLPSRARPFQAYDPRALKGNGVTYITSPMGADHTAGNAFETAKTVNPIGNENQVENSRRLQIRAAILDTMGLCLFTRPPFVKKPELFALFLKGRYGWDVTYEDVQKIGIDALETEREFNRRAGVSEEFFDVPGIHAGRTAPSEEFCLRHFHGRDAADLGRRDSKRCFLKQK